MAARHRLETIRNHLRSSEIPALVTDEQPSIPIKRQDVLKWNGWGYRDSRFEVDPDTHEFRFTGDRYKIGNKKLPLFRQWTARTLNIELDQKFEPQPEMENIPEPVLNEEFMDGIKRKKYLISTEGEERLFRSHGHTLHEIFTLRESSFPRIPDLVIWPQSTEDVASIVTLASKLGVVIIPFGGGTSVSGALECPAGETRMIVSLDMSQMNRCLCLDHRNLTATFEAGVVGQDLERRLAKHGFCTGHEPDSFEFSTLGGWVATRASGMKKNIYGNIEDLMVHVKMVTAKGILERDTRAPRISAGPDVHSFILGSEGTLGVITEVTLKIRPVPQVKKHASIVFPEFESGVLFMRQLAKKRLKPASVRLMDNEQFLFGQALKPESDSLMDSVADVFKKIYLTKIKGFDVEKLCVATLLFEGDQSEVDQLEASVIKLASDFAGLSAGEENGRRGYMLTFVIAYIRDLALDYGVVAESFETSIGWDSCSLLCRNVKERVRREAKKYHLIKPILITCRVTQTYDAGACVYFYFAFNYQNGFGPEATEKSPVTVYEAIEKSAREEILAMGGSISHHHGVGKIRKRWLQDTISPVGMTMLRALKSSVDPNNIFANGNLMIES